MSAIERQRAFLDYTLSSLVRRKGKNGALVLAYALVVFLMASVIFFARALRTEGQTILAGTPELLVQRLLAGRYDTIRAEYADTIRAIRGVSQVEPRLWGYYFNRAVGATFTVLGRADFAHADDEIVVGPVAAKAWTNLQDGRYLLRTAKGDSAGFKPVEVLPEESRLVSADLLLMSEAAFRRVFGMPEGHYTDLAVSVRNPQELQTVTEKIQRDFPDTRPIQREEILRTYESVFEWRGGLVIVLFASAALAFFIFAWDKATGLSAEERHEIGILKALGWDTADVLAMKFWEGLAISLTAFLLGTIAAYYHVFLANAGLFAQALKGWSVLYVDFPLSPEIDLTELLALFFLAVAPYTFITVIPTWRAAITDPDTVMRGS
ncbi:ABC transporter permease [Desulfovibrio sp. TomC]|uniref:ABC transporter permease n=1 Tax=Desulfovibrio sp. TomC TaxID=1562888 RepID=UPI000573DA4B|nr:FtsX-like permease family protein [Desulfovibrio sp. TomC]KHK03949.1 ABC transporter, permease protein [Desulfovibrio sp. TomC]